MDKRVISIERQRKRFYKSAKAIMRSALHSYYSEFFEQVSKCEDKKGMDEVARKFLKDDKIQSAFKQIYIPVGKYFGEQSYDSIRKRYPQKSRPENIEEDYWLSWFERNIKGKLGKRITWISNTTKDEFIRIVDKVAGYGFENGIGIPEIAKQLQYELGISEKYRAERIARTEVISASNLSTQAGAEATGIALDKEWISYIDDRTRESHIAINGEKVDMNETFSNGLEVPGDPNGESEEVINCRCTVGYISKEDSDYGQWGRNL